MINPFHILLYNLYILQLENFELYRYFPLIFRLFKRRDFSMRQQIIWTAKLKITAIISWMIGVFTITALLYIFHEKNLPTVILALLVYVYVFSYLSFFTYGFAVIILSPIDFILKEKIIREARNKMEKYSRVKVIGIAGSYGKTTMKEIISTVLSTKYSVLKTPENINTPLGISRLINSKLKPETEILIAEMGEFYKGDISRICSIAKPDTVVITGINEAHYERLKTIDTTIQTIFEIAVNSKPDAAVFMNADDKNISGNYKKYIINRAAYFYNSSSLSDRNIKIKPVKFHIDGSGQTIEIRKRNKLLGKVTIPLLADYALGDIHCAIQIALLFGLSTTEIMHGLQLLRPIAHRLEPVPGTNNVLIIDDSYNGNPEGVNQAIKVLNKFKGRRKIYVTPGLVETGNRMKQIHYKLGEQLADVVDRVVLIENSVTPAILVGLRNKNFPEQNIIRFKSTLQAHQSIGQLLKDGDVVLFQNDWPDNYL